MGSTLPRLAVGRARRFPRRAVGLPADRTPPRGDLGGDRLGIRDGSRPDTNPAQMRGTGGGSDRFGPVRSERGWSGRAAPRAAGRSLPGDTAERASLRASEATYSPGDAADVEAAGEVGVHRDDPRRHAVDAGDADRDLAGEAVGHRPGRSSAVVDVERNSPSWPSGPWTTSTRTSAGVRPASVDVDGDVAAWPRR